jgi:hypothetical protein
MGADWVCDCGERWYYEDNAIMDDGCSCCTKEGTHEDKLKNQLKEKDEIINNLRKQLEEVTKKLIKQ